MVYLFLVWLKIAIYGLTIGRLFFKDAEPVPKMWAGVCISTIFAEIFNFFLPVNTIFQNVGDVLVLILAVLQWKSLKKDFIEMFEFIVVQSKPSVPFFTFMVALVVLFSNSARSMVTDMGFYYLQTIKWIHEYPIVPGLGNLFTRLANNSNWFVACAVFNPKWILPAYALNGFLFFTAVLYMLKCYYDLTIEIDARTRCVFYALCVGAVITLYQWKVETPNTDVAVTLLFWIVAILFVISEKDVLRTKKLQILVAFLALFIPTIKLNYLPLAIIPGYLLWKNIRRGEWSFALALIIVGTAIFLPWCIRSLILSGYLVFPVYQIDLFNFDWKMPEEILIHENDLIKWWARVPNIDTAISSKMKLSEWLPLWILNLSLINKVLLVTTITGSILYLKDIVCGKIIEENHNITLFLTSLCGILLCVIAAPDLRFCYGFILLLNAIAFKDYIFKFFSVKNISETAFLFSMVCAVANGILVGRTSDTGFFVPCHKYPSSLRTGEVNGIKIHMAQAPGEMGSISPEDSNWVRWWKNSHRGIYEDRLWDADLPASPYIRKGLTLRGESLKEGFRVRKL